MHGCMGPQGPWYIHSLLLKRHWAAQHRPSRRRALTSSSSSASTGAAVGFLSPVVAEEESEGLDVGVEPQGRHGRDDVLGRDGLAALAVALGIGLGGDVGDELRQALLDRLLGVVRHLRLRRQHPSHDPHYVGDRHVLVRPPHEPRLHLLAAAFYTALSDDFAWEKVKNVSKK